MSLDFDLAAFGIWYVVFLFSTTCHEAAHGWVAQLGGDATAYHGGQVSLDPVAHIRRSPFGMLLVPVLSFYFWHFLMGWASVPFDTRWGKRHPLRQALMSLAGPMTNFLLALVGVGIVAWSIDSGTFQLPSTFGFTRLVEQVGGNQQGSLGSALALGLSVLVNLNVLLGLFNLVPLPPLDGAGVLEGLFPRVVGGLYDQIRAIPILQLASMLAAWRLIPFVIDPAFSMVFRVIRSVSRA